MSKRSQKLKQKILDALEDESPFQKTIKSLIPLFFALAIQEQAIKYVLKEFNK